MTAPLSVLTLIAAGLLMTSTVRAGQNNAIYLAAGPGPLLSGNTQSSLLGKDKTTLTQAQQKESGKVVKATADLPKTMVKRKMLFINARTIKIITRNGATVTLHGPVASADLERIAKQMPGVPGR